MQQHQTRSGNSVNKKHNFTLSSCSISDSSYLSMGRPTTQGNTEVGKFSPANPHFTYCIQYKFQLEKLIILKKSTNIYQHNSKYFLDPLTRLTIIIPSYCLLNPSLPESSDLLAQEFKKFAKNNTIVNTQLTIPKQSIRVDPNNSSHRLLETLIIQRIC